MLTNVLSILSIACYLLAALEIFLRLWRDAAVRRSLVLALGALAAALHGVVLSQTVLSDGQLDVSFFDVFSLVAWGISVVALLVASFRRVEGVGIIVFPAAAFFVALQMIWGESHRIMVSYGWQIDLHIILAVLSHAVLGVASAHALLLALQERALRKHQVSGPVRVLPPLQTMESILFQLIATGFVLLSGTLITGAVFVENLFEQHLVHKTVLSFIAWLVFGVLLWGRWKFGWRGRTAIRMTLIGIFILLLAYFGSKMVLELILHRI